jgi:hypothetical protein
MSFHMQKMPKFLRLPHALPSTFDVSTIETGFPIETSTVHQYQTNKQKKPKPYQSPTKNQNGPPQAP